MDLANDELQFPSKPFASYFQDGKRAGLKVTGMLLYLFHLLVFIVHAGESLTSNIFAANVKEAIDLLGAERIGHGVGIITDPSILEYVKQKGVVLEVCPTRYDQR
jgi:adenosine deaminase